MCAPRANTSLPAEHEGLIRVYWAGLKDYNFIEMQAWLRHLRARDLRFTAFVALELVLMAAYLAGGYRGLGQQGHGFRRIDLQALEARMDAGDLSRHEAQWYHPARVSPGQGEGP